MKTQLFISTTLLAIALLWGNNSNAESKMATNTTVSEVTISTQTLANNNSLSEEIEIEDWMSNNKIWRVQETVSSKNEESSDESVAIEEWMTNDALFRISPYNWTTTDKDFPMCIEKWMTDKTLWRL